MSASKKSPATPPENANDIVVVHPPFAPVPAVNNEIEEKQGQICEKVVYSSTYEDQSDLLAKNSREFQHIMALYQGLLEADTSNFSQVKKNALNIVDTFPERYQRRFSIPDRLICFRVECGKDGSYYLCLNHGYLCFDHHPSHKYRTFIPIVKEPFDQPRVDPN